MRSLAHKLDSEGRLVIPAEIRKRLGLEPGTPLEFFTRGSTVIVRPYRPGCAICGECSGIVRIGAVALCRDCIRQFAEKASA